MKRKYHSQEQVEVIRFWKPYVRPDDVYLYGYNGNHPFCMYAPFEYLERDISAKISNPMLAIRVKSLKALTNG